MNNAVLSLISWLVIAEIPRKVVFQHGVSAQKRAFYVLSGSPFDSRVMS